MQCANVLLLFLVYLKLTFLSSCWNHGFLVLGFFLPHALFAAFIKFLCFLASDLHSF